MKKMTDILILIIILIMLITVCFFISCEKTKKSYSKINDNSNLIINDIMTENTEEYENCLSDYKKELINKNDKVILIGDSYGTTYINSFKTEWIGWAEQFEVLFPECECYTSAVGGTGLYKRKRGFERQLEDIINDNPDLSNVSDIVLVGGYNDIKEDLVKGENNLDESMASFVELARRNWPDVRISYMYVAKDYNSVETSDLIVEYESIFKKVCEEYDVIYVENANKIINSIDDIYINDTDANSGFHPNDKGNKKIAISIAEYLATGKIKEK